MTAGIFVLTHMCERREDEGRHLVPGQAPGRSILVNEFDTAELLLLGR